MSRSTAVDFTLRANITDLKSELGKIPGITDKEAKKMASNLERQLLRSERAAKKTAAAMRGDLGQSVGKVAEKFRNLSSAVGMSEETFESLKTKAVETAGTVERFGDQVGQADSSLSAMAGALHNVNPELAEMTRKGADALGAVEGLINAARGGPVVFAATAASVMVLHAATHKLSEAATKYEEQNEKASRRQDKMHAQLRRQEEIGNVLSKQYDVQVLKLSETEKAYKEMNQRIAGTVRRLQDLAYNTPNYGAIVEQTEDWAARQYELNRAIHEGRLEQERTAEAYKQLSLQAQLSQNQMIGLSIAAANLSKTTKTANKEMLAETEHIAFLDSTTKAYAVTQRKQIKDTYDAAEGNKRLQAGLVQVEGAYVNQLRSVATYAADAEKATGTFYRVLDYRGVSVSEDTGKVTKGLIRTYQDLERQYYETGISIQDMQTGEIMTQGQLIAKVRAADIARRESSKARRKQAAEEKRLTDQAALDQLSALALQHAAAVDKQNLDAMTTESMLNELERRAQAELDAMEASLDAQELLSAEAQEKIDQARLDVEQRFETERTEAAKEAAAEFVSIFDRAVEEMTAKQIDQPLLSAAGVKAMEKAGDTAAKLRQEFKAAGEDIPPLIEAQLQGLESMDQMAAAIPKFLLDYVQALAAAQARFDAVWSQMGGKIEEQAAHLSTFFSGVSEAAGVAADLMADKNKKAAMKAFRIQQGAAISEAVINGAVAISKVQGQLGVFSPFAIAGIVASTAAQVATIAAEQPAFDVGGVIGGSMARTPDQVSIRALPGEAVLNRRAVDQLGEDGVDRLNNGGSPEVVVRPVSTFKHFDRFTRAEFRRSGYFRSLFDQDREFAVGQRRY